MEWAGARLLCVLRLMCRRNRPRNLHDRNETISPSPVLQLSPSFFYRPTSTRPITTPGAEKWLQIFYWDEAKAIIFGGGTRLRVIATLEESRARRDEPRVRTKDNGRDLFKASRLILAEQSLLVQGERGLGRIRDKGEPILQIYLAIALPLRGTLILLYEFSGVQTRTTHEASNSRQSPPISFSPTGSGTSAVCRSSCPLRGMLRHDEQ